MSPKRTDADRCRTFLQQRPLGAVRVQLAADNGTGITQIGEWERSLIEQADSGDHAADIAQQAQDYTDGVGLPTRFLVRWLTDKDRATKVLNLRCTPAEPLDASTAANAYGVSDASVIRDLLGALDKSNTQLRQMAETLQKNTDTNRAAYEATITMLTQQLQTAFARQLEAPEPAEVRAPTEAETEELLARVDALRAFTGTMREKFPVALELFFAWASQRMLPPGDAAPAAAAAATPAVRVVKP